MRIAALLLFLCWVSSGAQPPIQHTPFTTNSVAGPIVSPADLTVGSVTAGAGTINGQVFVTNLNAGIYIGRIHTPSGWVNGIVINKNSLGTNEVGGISLMTDGLEKWQIALDVAGDDLCIYSPIIPGDTLRLSTNAQMRFGKGTASHPSGDAWLQIENPRIDDEWHDGIEVHLPTNTPHSTFSGSTWNDKGVSVGQGAYMSMFGTHTYPYVYSSLSTTYGGVIGFNSWWNYTNWYTGNGYLQPLMMVLQPNSDGYTGNFSWLFGTNTIHGTAGAFIPYEKMTLEGTGKLGVGSRTRGGVPSATIEASDNGTLSSAELITNGGFDSDTTGWTSSNSDLDSIAGGQSGNCLAVTNSSAATGYAYQTFSTIIGCRYLLSVYHKNGATTGNLKLGISPGGSQIYASGAASDANWTEHRWEFVATDTTTYISLVNGATTLNLDTLWDTVTVKQVLGGGITSRGIVRSDSGFSAPIAFGGSYTLTDNDSTYMLTVDNQIATVPSYGGRRGRCFTIGVLAPATTGTVATTSNQRINGALNYGLSASNKLVTIQGGITGWVIVGHN